MHAFQLAKNCNCATSKLQSYQVIQNCIFVPQNLMWITGKPQNLLWTTWRPQNLMWITWKPQNLLWITKKAINVTENCICITCADKIFWLSGGLADGGGEYSKAIRSKRWNFTRSPLCWDILLVTSVQIWSFLLSAFVTWVFFFDTDVFFVLFVSSVLFWHRGVHSGFPSLFATTWRWQEEK